MASKNQWRVPTIGMGRGNRMLQSAGRLVRRAAISNDCASALGCSIGQYYVRWRRRRGRTNMVARGQNRPYATGAGNPRLRSRTDHSGNAVFVMACVTLVSRSS